MAMAVITATTVAMPIVATTGVTASAVMAMIVRIAKRATANAPMAKHPAIMAATIRATATAATMTATAAGNRNSDQARQASIG